MEKMNPEIKKMWVEALRSGAYTQATGALCMRDEDSVSHCCLGVLCDLHARATCGTWEPSLTDAEQMVYDGKQGVLPDSVVAWSGLDDAEPTVFREDDALFQSLADLNDGGAPFSRIADLIEASL